jgi:hypothetical protein
VAFRILGICQYKAARAAFLRPGRGYALKPYSSVKLSKTAKACAAPFEVRPFQEEIEDGR